MIRLIATDLDGTLLEPNGALPDGVFDVIHELREQGIYFAASSGRQYGNLRRLFGPVADDMAYVCENGALCVEGGQVIGSIPMSYEQAMEVIADVQAAGMNLLISGKHTSYVLDENRAYTDDIVYRLRNTVTVIRDFSEITEPILKVSGQLDAGVGQIAPMFLAKWGSRLTATVSGRDWFDFTVANKGMGLQMMMDKLGVTKEEAAAFGDNFNDETMLQSVGYPFLMAHADPSLRFEGVRLCEKVLPVLREIARCKGRLA